MGRISQALGLATAIEFEGKNYAIGPLTYEVQAQFERWLEKRAMDVVQRLKERLDDDAFGEALSRVVADISAGKYAFFSRGALEAMRSFEGFKHLLFLRMRSADPKNRDLNAEFIERLLDEKLDEVQTVLRSLEEAPQDSEAEEDGDPNVPASPAP